MAFVGRVLELSTLAEELQRARSGEPRVVVVDGEAGVGKSSLLGRFASGLERVRVIRAGGDEGEQLLPYGVLAQLAGDAVPTDGVPSSPLAAGAALVRMLGSAQDVAGHPVVVIVDDLHWADQESADAVLFAARRLRADRVLVVVSTRPGGLARLGEGWGRFIAGDDRVRRIALAGFGRAELTALGDAMGVHGLPPAAVTSLLEHTAGNPLYCRALLEELDASDLHRAGRHGIPAPRALASVINAKLSVLSDDARALLVSLSVLGLRALLASAGALAGLSEQTRAVQAAAAAGLLHERNGALGREIAFPHPLIRRAVYDDLSPVQRAELHLSAAELLGGTAALDHRVAAAAGVDDTLAAELELAASEAAAERRTAQAATWLAQSAALSVAPHDRERRLLDAFEQSLVPGEVGLASALEPDVVALDRSARASGLLGYLAVLRGNGVAGEQHLQRAWDTHDPSTEPLVGAAAAANMSLATLIAAQAPEGLMWADRALTAAQNRSPELVGVALVMGAVALTMLGRGGEAEQRLSVLPPRAADIPDEASDALVMRGLVNLWRGNLHAGRTDLALAAARQRAGVPLRFQSQSLAYLGDAEFRLGAWDDAVVHTELAVSLSHTADRELDYAFVHAYAALVPANRGEWDVAQHHVSISRDIAVRAGVPGYAAVAAMAGAMLAAAREDPAGVLEATALVRAAGYVESSGRPGTYLWRTYEIDALIATGRLDDAAQTLDEFEALIPAEGLQSAAVALARMQGTLAAARGDDAAAAACFADGWAAAEGLEVPFDLGLLALADGRRLRQVGDRVAAIDMLRRARDTFTSLRAQPYVEACERELEQCGVAREVEPASADFGLTPAELVVARLVATGKSNRETAEELYVTVKTVEFHLRGVFAKLGISSRRQIAALLGGRN
jgi:DNA-binding CsgD family transcriptional regulator